MVISRSPLPRTPIDGDLLGARAGRVEAVGEPLAHEAAGELDADDALAHA